MGRSNNGTKSGGSGATHGGLGGLGSGVTYSEKSYGSCLSPADFGSGGAEMSTSQTDGAGQCAYKYPIAILLQLLVLKKINAFEDQSGKTKCVTSP